MRAGPGAVLGNRQTRRQGQGGAYRQVVNARPSQRFVIVATMDVEREDGARRLELRKTSAEGGTWMARSAWRVLTVFLPVFLYLSPGRPAAAGAIDITVMTQNLYTGADTNPILMAATIPELQNAIKAAAQSVIDNNFPLRAAAIAAEAAKAGGPLLIGLQEAEIVGQAGVSLNYADTLIAALKTQGVQLHVYDPRSGGRGPHRAEPRFSRGWPPWLCHPHRSGCRVGTNRCAGFYGHQRFRADLHEPRDHREPTVWSNFSPTRLRAAGRNTRWSAVSIRLDAS